LRSAIVETFFANMPERGPPLLISDRYSDDATWGVVAFLIGAVRDAGLSAYERGQALLNLAYFDWSAAHVWALWVRSSPGIPEELKGYAESLLSSRGEAREVFLGPASAELTAFWTDPDVFGRRAQYGGLDTSAYYGD
jgi:hypothetical protein